MKIHRINLNNTNYSPWKAVEIDVGGCSHFCDYSPSDFHNRDEDKEISVDDILQFLIKHSPSRNLVLTGNDPLKYPEQMIILCHHLKEKGWKIACHTSYRLEDIAGLKVFKENKTRSVIARMLVLYYLDILVDQEFNPSLKVEGHKILHSSNQRIIDVPKSVKRGELVLWKPKRSILDIIRRR